MARVLPSRTSPDDGICGRHKTPVFINHRRVRLMCRVKESTLDLDYRNPQTLVWFCFHSLFAFFAEKSSQRWISATEIYKRRTTGALEAAYTQLTGKSISLSEQQLVDCASAYNNFGCNGGLPSQAFEYIKYNGGLDTEEAYPYQGVNGLCSFKSENVGVKVINSVNITLGDEDELKHAVGLVRPVSVAFEVATGFRFYKKGVFSSDVCGNTPMDVNHAVLAVGYGVEDGISYWLIKNSWGEDWGDSGYFKMESGKNMCGVATCASYPVVAE